MTWRERRAARLRAKAAQLDPDGTFVPVTFGELSFSITWEECCQVPYFNTDGIGAPLYRRVADTDRMTNETTAIPAADHGPFPVDEHDER